MKQPIVTGYNINIASYVSVRHAWASNGLDCSRMMRCSTIDCKHVCCKSHCYTCNYHYRSTLYPSVINNWNYYLNENSIAHLNCTDQGQYKINTGVIFLARQPLRLPWIISNRNLRDTQWEIAYDLSHIKLLHMFITKLGCNYSETSLWWTLWDWFFFFVACNTEVLLFER